MKGVFLFPRIFRLTFPSLSRFSVLRGVVRSFILL